MGKKINHQQLTETLGLTECNDGFWLYDKTRGMNLAMRADNETSAFVKALTYYQRRLAEVEKEHKELREKVSLFVGQFVDDGEDWGN